MAELKQAHDGVWTMPVSELDPTESMNFTIKLLRNEGASKTVARLERKGKSLIALRRRTKTGR